MVGIKPSRTECYEEAIRNLGQSGWGYALRAIAWLMLAEETGIQELARWTPPPPEPSMPDTIRRG